MSKVDLSEPINNYSEYKKLISVDSNSGPYYRPPVEIFFANLKRPERQKRLLYKLIMRYDLLFHKRPFY